MHRRPIEPGPLRRSGPEPLDRLWHLAFPSYYLTLTVYAAFAIVTPIGAVTSVLGLIQSHLFAICLTAAAGAAGAVTVVGLFRRVPRAEIVVEAGLLVLLAVYTWTVVQGEGFGPGGGFVRPGSGFLPIALGVFPFVRVLVAIRRLRQVPGR